MKKSQLRQIIREEIRKLNENNVYYDKEWRTINNEYVPFTKEGAIALIKLKTQLNKSPNPESTLKKLSKNVLKYGSSPGRDKISLDDNGDIVYDDYNEGQVTFTDKDIKEMEKLVKSKNIITDKELDIK